VGAFSFGGAFSTDFAQTNNCGTTVAAGSTCTINITFTPTASEIADAQLLITATNGSVMGALTTGTGNIPITLTPRNQSFGYYLIGTTSPGKTNTFTNDSGVNIFFTNIDLEGVNQNDFSFTTTCPISPTVALGPGASCTSTVFFKPSITGHETVTMVYYGNFTLVKQGLLINGDGTAVKVSPTSLNFGTVKVGTSSSPKTVTFQNAGSTPLAITSVTFTGANNDWTQTNTCNFPGGSVPANSTCTFSVVFTPGGTGARSATMNIGNGDPTGPQHVSLSGTGN